MGPVPTQPPLSPDHPATRLGLVEPVEPIGARQSQPSRFGTGAPSAGFHSMIRSKNKKKKYVCGQCVKHNGKNSGAVARFHHVGSDSKPFTHFRSRFVCDSTDQWKHQVYLTTLRCNVSEPARAAARELLSTLKGRWVRRRSRHALSAAWHARSRRCRSPQVCSADSATAAQPSLYCSCF